MKVILFANTDWYLYNFRLPLAKALRARGDTVTLVSPPGPYVERLVENGFRWVKFPLTRRSLNPLAELLAIARLIKLYRCERPDMVHHFTIKCVLYGSLAARLLGLPVVVNSITGLGYAFSTDVSWLRKAVSLLYKLFLRETWVIFQNPSDRDIFLRWGWVAANRCRLIRGSGVDVQYFTPQREPDGTPIILFPARLLWPKGVGEFVQAARLLRETGVTARFVLVGDVDPGNPESVPENQLHAWTDEGVVEWWGWQEDMRAVYGQSTLVCLPTYYHEGVPKALLEAAACGRALISSDEPGCREIVHEGYTGLRVPARDSVMLANAISKLLEDPQLCSQMGKNGREVVINQFSVERVIIETLNFYEEAVNLFKPRG